MRNIIIVVSVVLFSLGSLSAQSFIVNVNPNPKSNSVQSSNQDTLKILGVLVDFPEDKDGTTFGNGKFGSIYSKDYGNDILDPLPHDKNYFETHLEFVKNYFNKVSDGKVIIEYNVLPDVFTVSQTMRNYSPPNNSDNFKPVGDFAAETWDIVSSNSGSLDFSKYDIFIIFHAGVGRDVSLPGSLGNENDLPSVYLGLNTLKDIYGNDFDGFQINNSSFKIQNSMIIPETENREVETFGGTILFEITINGLIVASVASHLGLPDLFDTETGLSAIGRFGLMDGQSIFAYNGAFPPEPSAWEKIYLGWETPVELTKKDYNNLTLTTNHIASLTDTTILKIPINSSEYYLVENRIRDASSNGSVITYVVNGDTVTKSFSHDTTAFYSYDVDTLAGVVINVDEFDWAIPGNGIVIWHIDENVINSKISENAINNDKTHRGVDVEEADGIQDIGEQFRTIFGDVVIGEGEDVDFWYKDNPAELYENKFTKDTRPSTRTNNYANSLISFTNFSDISNKMSFNLMYGDSIVKPIFSKNFQEEISGGNITSLPDNNGFAITASGKTFMLDEQGNILETIENFSTKKTASFVSGGTYYVVGVYDSLLNVYMRKDSITYFSSLDVKETITSFPLIRTNNDGDFTIQVGAEGGKILIYSTGELPSTDPEPLGSIHSIPDYKIVQFIDDGGHSVVLGNDGLNYGLIINNIIVYTFAASNPEIALTKNSRGEYVTILLEDDSFKIFTNQNLTSEFERTFHESNSFSVGDLKQDGENYIVYPDGKKLVARNLSGALAEYFSFEDPEGNGFSGVSLVADFEGDNNAEVIATTLNGRVYAIDGGTGKVINSFPISSGAEISTNPVLFVANNKLSLGVVNNDNNFATWKISSTEGNVFWGESFANRYNKAFVKAAESVNYVNEFFPADRVYNYPNPVYEGVTYIRYYVAGDSKINIKIFDLAGDFVDELNDTALGGFDNETEWDVSDIQSGIYIARVEATGNNGKTEHNIIKIAVVK